MVADHCAYYRPVLLLDMCTVIGVAGTGSGEGEPPLLTPVQQVVADELCAVVALSMPSSGNGRTLAMPANGAMTHVRALFGTDRFSVQPVAISVTVRVYACSPIALPPS